MREVVKAVTTVAAVTVCVVAAVVVGRRVRKRYEWVKAVNIVREFEEGCDTNVERLQQVADAIAVEMNAGLASEGGSKLRMLLTHVDKLPNGNEKGDYYALDLGTNKFRVLRVHLGGKRSSGIDHVVEQIPIPKHLLSSTVEDLFNFIASSLNRFLEREASGADISSVQKRGLGFSFPFPVKQSSVSSGVLIKWTKAFAISDMVGKDVAQCLQQALTKKGLDVQVAALVNDAVGTLALGHYYDEDTVASVIFGTGTNACYMERPDAIIKSQGILTSSRGMVVNVELGNFWSSHLPRTSYDDDLDADSPNPDDQGFEKMISGMYLGDIVRRVLLRISLESDLFGRPPAKLSKPFALGTPLIAAMHEDISTELTEVARICEEILEIPDVPLKVHKLVVKICDIVTRRAARLAAAGIVGILKKIARDGSGGIGSGRSRSIRNMKRTVVAVEGRLYTSYTMFREYLNDALVEILGKDIAANIILKVTNDGSGIGTALLAASYSA